MMGTVSIRDQLREQRFELARRKFFEENEIPEDGVPTVILSSWQRCRSLGLDHARSGPDTQLGRARLSEARERSACLLEQSSCVMEHVFEQIRASGSMVILADAQGVIIHSLGDPDFVGRADRVALSPGAGWGETQRGTNAIGTAIAEQSAVEVLGGEHFMSHNGFLSCTAAPVFGLDGCLVGVLDISSDHRAHQRHTMGLVRLSVQLLEKRMFEARFANDLIVAFHARPEYIGSLQEAAVAVNSDGLIIGANSIARDWLAARNDERAEPLFANLISQSFGTIFDRAVGAPSSLLKVSLRQGGELYLQVRNLGVRAVYGGSGQRSPRESRCAAEVASLKQSQQIGTQSVRDDGSEHGGRAEPVTLTSLATGDAGLARALDRARRIQGKDIPLLVQGESGVGKELFAQAFHNSGPRAGGPFVALNCAAVPETLIESELFGYVGGAFTGARREGAIGRIQQANGGTLFLDEIGDMPLGMQARLLRVLQERCVTPVGALRSIPVDISLVCATHRVLKDLVARGEFREDLYYRVNSLTVCLPPLRNRTDISVLVRRILEQEAREAGRDEVVIGEEVMRFFERHDWPGNIRQLQNVIRVAVALLDPDEFEVLPLHLPEELFSSDPADDGEPRRHSAMTVAALERPCGVESGTGPAGITGISFEPDCTQPSGSSRLEQLELDAINAVMREVGGNISAAARILGVSRNRLYRKLGRLN